MRKKISVIGAGRVGENTALFLAQRALGDVVLVDIVPNMAAGKALDLMAYRPVVGADVNVVGTTEMEASMRRTASFAPPWSGP